MPCWYPLKGWRSATPNEEGKHAIVFKRSESWTDSYQPLTLPCGRCSGCKLERARQWAVRCMHEASLCQSNIFITLTFNDDHLPPDGSLDVRHFQLFMKRLRRKYGPTRFFHCGEYGDQFGRPHYHALLFNRDFSDRVFWKYAPSGEACYISEQLDELWSDPSSGDPYGFTSLGAVTFESAAYCARYNMKKITGPGAEDHYQGRKPEYITMSRNPGIGADWIKKYAKSDVVHRDSLVVNGQRQTLPRFYDLLIEKEHPKDARVNKIRRLVRAKSPEQKRNNTDERLLRRQTCREAQIKNLKRTLK